MAEQAGFNVSTFKSYLGAGGHLRNNKFVARFFIPVGLQGSPIERATGRFLEYRGENIVLPGLSLDVHFNNRYGYGMFEKKPERARVQDTRATFIMDQGGRVWEFFQEWIKLIANPDLRNGILTNFRGREPFILEYKDNYVAQIEIIVFDETGKEQIKVSLRDAFPISIGDLSLDWNDNNTIMHLPVFFAFTDYYNMNRPTQNPSQVPNQESFR